MTVGLNRASIFAIKKETVLGEYVEPTAGAEFVPLRPGNELSYEPESLENDEVLNDIGTSKSFTGKEVVKGKHAAYLKHSGVEGQEPEVGLLYESIMGSKQITAVEPVTIAASTVSVLKVGAGLGASRRVGEALLIKDGTNGYSIRNIAKIVGDDLTLNFVLGVAPAAGVNMGKAVSYLPVAQGHPTFSTTKYLGNGFAKECSAGNTVTECSITTEANGFGEVEFAFEGTNYLFNPLEVTALNKYLDLTDDDGTIAVSIPEKIYKTPIQLADALESALNSLSTQTYTVKYDNNTGKFIIASSTTALLSLLLNTGVNAANSIGTLLGYTVAADKTGALTYTSDNSLVYTTAVVPSFDVADSIVIKGAELMIGDQSDNLTIHAQSVKLSIKKEVEDVDDISAETGIMEKIPTGRSAEMTVTAVLKKHDAALLDALLKNKGISAMLNAGPKTGGNWIPGKCWNAYLQSCTVSKYTTGGDSFIQVDMTLKGYVTSTSKDIYLNFV
jgi:hypothetical protein